MKWIWVIVLVVVGIIAAFVAVEYLTTSIHALPSYIPGHESLVHGRKPRGRYHKRGAVAAVIAVLAFLGAGYLAYRNWKASQTEAASGLGSSTDQLV